MAQEAKEEAPKAQGQDPPPPPFQEGLPHKGGQKGEPSCGHRRGEPPEAQGSQVGAVQVEGEVGVLAVHPHPHPGHGHQEEGRPVAQEEEEGEEKAPEGREVVKPGGPEVGQGDELKHVQGKNGTARLEAGEAKAQEEEKEARRRRRAS